uniref:FBA_2 domain-containing protein n=2 Tax=Caenorhabditis tropicalis TaxID=1561998 RepID=A0A1I7T958_9PELO
MDKSNEKRREGAISKKSRADMSEDESETDEEECIMVRAATSFFRERERNRYLSVIATYIKTFESWQLMDDNCKMSVIKHLDYKTRCRLERCSRADSKLVKNVPLNVYGIEFMEQSKETGHESTRISITIEFEKDANEKFELFFEQSSNDTVIKWIRTSEYFIPTKFSLTIEKSNYQEEAVKFVEKWMKKCKYGISKITVGMDNFPIETSNISFLPNLKIVKMCIENENKIKKWFEKFPEELEDVQLTNRTWKETSIVVSPDVIDSPQIMNAKKLFFFNKIDLSGELLFQLKATRFSFHSDRLTEKDINQFIRNWTNGKCVEEFKEAVFWSKEERDLEQITSGIELIQWDQTFKREYPEFWESFTKYWTLGVCYQVKSRINPFHSISLNFTGRTVSIYVTGKAKQVNGVKYTRYRIP